MGIYDDIGVRPFINAWGTHTRFGGSIMSERVAQAMLEASRLSVEIEELAAKVGAEIAQLTFNEAAYVSGGAAAGIALAIASCMTGTDPRKCERLPDTTGMKAKVIMHKAGRFWEDVAVQAPGVQIEEIGNSQSARERDLANALDADTAAVVTCDWPGLIPVARVVELSHAADVPVIVDAAGDVPPKENLWRFTRDLNADAVVVSGGKGLRGPQGTGLVLGRREIIAGCAANGNPNRGIGRTMKVAKEEMVGLFEAVRQFLDTEAFESERIDRSSQALISRLGAIPGAQFDTDAPLILIDLRPSQAPSDRQLMDALRNGTPSIMALCRNRVLYVNVSTLQPDEDMVVADRLIELLA